MVMRSINTDERRGYFKKVLEKLGKTSLDEIKPALKDLGVTASQMTIVRRDMEKLNINESIVDYLCLLDTIKIVDQFSTIKKGIESVRHLEIIKFHDDYKLFLLTIESDSMMNNFLRLFMRKPHFFFETEGGKAVLEDIAQKIGRVEDAQEAFFEIMSKLWFQKITGTYDKEKFRSWLEKLKPS
jgi:hypothetical protein